jgi:bacterioferritin (cytochrome b1)
MDKKYDLAKLLQKALELENAAYVQYLSHAAIVSNQNSLPIEAHLRETAEDEAKHAEILRQLLGNYLTQYPSMKIADTQEAIDISSALRADVKSETAAIEHYKKTLKYIEDNKDLKFYNTMWEKIRQILIEEEEHLVELEMIQG